MCGAGRSIGWWVGRSVGRYVGVGSFSCKQMRQQHSITCRMKGGMGTKKDNNIP